MGPIGLISPIGPIRTESINQTLLLLFIRRLFLFRLLRVFDLSGLVELVLQLLERVFGVLDLLILLAQRFGFLFDLLLLFVLRFLSLLDALLGGGLFVLQHVELGLGLE